MRRRVRGRDRRRRVFGRTMLATAAVASPVVLTPVQSGVSRPTVAATGYCIPSNHAADPRDVPAGGSKIALPRGVIAQVVRAAGLHTVVLQAGPRHAREAVVFLHGNPGSSQDWDQLLPKVGKFVRAVAFDLPGFGHASKPFSVDAVGLYPRFMAAVLARLGIVKVHLVVHDIGAIAGLIWAGEHPAGLASAVIIDSGVPIGWHLYPIARTWATPGAGEQLQAATTRAGFTTFIRQETPRGMPSSFVNRMYDDYDRATRCAILSIYRSVNFSALGQLGAQVLSRNPKPALVIWGAADPYLPVSLAYVQRKAFPGAEVHIFRDSGHWPFIDNPAATARLVVPFLRAQVRRRVSG